MRRFLQRTELAAGRYFVEYNDYRAACWKQCFKFAALAACPFGKEIVYGGGAGSLILNIFWMILTGIPMALESLVMGVLLCITIIGIPLVCSILKWLSLL